MKKYIDLDEGKGLEIGPLANPIVTKSEGDITYTDWTDTQSLREKNKVTSEFDWRKIVDIDFVWKPSKSLKECIPYDKIFTNKNVENKFDYIVASHVIEHIPNTIGWLKELFDVLKVGGVLSLAIPDMRYTFDAYRKPTEMAELIETWMHSDVVPTCRQIYDNCSSAIYTAENISLVDTSVSLIDRQRIYTDAEAINFAKFAYFENQYIDIHCTSWNPDNIREIFGKICELNILQFEVLEVIPYAEEGEVCISLKKKDCTQCVQMPQKPDQNRELEHAKKAFMEAVEIQNIMKADIEEYKKEILKLEVQCQELQDKLDQSVNKKRWFRKKR